MTSELSHKSASRDGPSSSGVTSRQKAPESKILAGLFTAQRILGNHAVSGLVQSVGLPHMRAIIHGGDVSTTPGRDGASPAAISAQLGAGEQLPADVRGFFEPRIGQDLSAVRVFHGDRAAQIAEAANADALTIGHNIAFNTGRFAPWTTGGRKLLGHELAHVIQQGRGGPAPDGQIDSAAENDAQQAGRAAATGATRIQVRQSSAIGIARQEKQDDDERTRRNVGTANRLYTAFLSSPLVPDAAKKAVENTNEWLKREASAHGISDQQRDQILSHVVQAVGPDVVASAQTVVEPPVGPPPPKPPMQPPHPPPQAAPAPRRPPTIVNPPRIPLAINAPGPPPLLNLSAVLVPGPPGDQSALAPVSTGDLPRVPLALIPPGVLSPHDFSAFLETGPLTDQTLPAPPAPEPFDVSKFVDPSTPRDPAKIVWADDPTRRPTWLTGARYWTDARGNKNFFSPESGLSVWDREGKQLGLPAPGAEQAERALRAESQLSLTGGKRYVEGRGWLDDSGWQAYLEERSDKLRVEAERKIENLQGATGEWNKTQGGWAYILSQASHLLGGRSRDEPEKIVAGTRQDVEIALHQVEQARTPEELAEAEGHVRFAQGYGGTRLYNYEEDVFTGGERTITSIKVGAVVATAYVSAPVLFSYGGGALTLKVVGGAALTGGGLSAARQGVQLWEGTRRDFSFSEVGQGAAFGGGLALFPELAPVALGMGVESSADEFSQGHFKTGAFDAATVLLPFATKAAPDVISWARPRAAAIALRVGTGLSDFNPPIGALGSPRTPTIALRVGTGLSDFTPGLGPSGGPRAPTIVPRGASAPDDLTGGLAPRGGVSDFTGAETITAGGEAGPVKPTSAPAGRANASGDAPTTVTSAAPEARPIPEAPADQKPATTSEETKTPEPAVAGGQQTEQSQLPATVSQSTTPSPAPTTQLTPRSPVATRRLAETRDALSAATNQANVARAKVDKATADLDAAKQLASEANMSRDARALVRQAENDLHAAQRELRPLQASETQAANEYTAASQAQSRIAKLEGRVATLDQQITDQLHPPEGFTRAQIQAGRRPGLEPRPSDPSGNEYRRLVAERDTALRQLQTETQGLTQSLSDQVTAATPGAAGRPVALHNAQSLPTALQPQNGVPIDVETGQPMTTKKWAVDHIVSRTEIAADPRYNRLSPLDRDAILLNVPENYLPITTEANSSKGTLSVDEWIAARQRSGQALPKDVADALRVADQRARAAIEKFFSDHVPQ